MTKTVVEDLAIFGGKSAFKDPLHVGRPNIGNQQRFLERTADILDRKWLTNGGVYVREFEEQIAESTNTEHCVAVCNATIGLQIAIRALGMSGEIIVPSFTAVATVHAIQWQGINPVFCDIDARTHTLDPERVEQVITPRTTGIIGVNLWGNPCDIDALGEIASRHGLKLLFDSAHAFNCSYRGRMIGGFGNGEVFSFHATKFLNSLEGGAIVTNDAELAHKVRLMQNCGCTSHGRADSIGNNGKLNEVSAAMGLTNLESMADFVFINHCNYKCYQEELGNLKGVRLLPYDEEEKCNYQYVVLEIDERKTILTRDQLIEILQAENVLARRHFYPGCHRVEPYRLLYPNAHAFLPQTERLAAQVMILPTGQEITPGKVSIICDVIRTALRNAGSIRRRMEESGGCLL